MNTCETFFKELSKGWKGNLGKMFENRRFQHWFRENRSSHRNDGMFRPCNGQIDRFVENCFGKLAHRKSGNDLPDDQCFLDEQGEEKTVTILMADLRDYTQLADNHEPDEVMVLLNEYISRMIAVIEKHRGTIVDFYGDGILVFFNGSERDMTIRAADAVRCAMDMQKELRKLAKENKRKDRPPMFMGVGIHTGQVAVGYIGSETRKKFGIVGSAVIEANRIQSLALAGQVVVSESTRKVLHDTIQLGPKFEAVLKGFEGHRTLYQVHGIVAA